jgi:DNA-directed RNA polymerase omega subunit
MQDFVDSTMIEPTYTHSNAPEYTIGVAAQLSELPLWLLRELDTRGIIVPQRTGGNQRLYSREDISRLKVVHHLVKDRGVNLAGVQVILEIEPHLRAAFVEIPMLYPSADKLNEFPSRYMLVLLAAKRAKQLKEGAQPLVACDSNHPLTIALEEIAQGKIKPRFVESEVEVEEVIMESIPLEPEEEFFPVETLAITEVITEVEVVEEGTEVIKPTLASLLGGVEPLPEELVAVDDASLAPADDIRGLQELLGDVSEPPLETLTVEAEIVLTEEPVSAESPVEISVIAEPLAEEAVSPEVVPIVEAGEIEAAAEPKPKGRKKKATP